MPLGKIKTCFESISFHAVRDETLWLPIYIVAYDQNRFVNYRILCKANMAGIPPGCR